MGVLASAYGPLLELLANRFEVTLSVAGGVLSAHFLGALLGVVVSMRILQRVPIRTFAFGALGCLGVGCAGAAVVALALWPLVGGMSGRLPFTAQTAADRSGALMAIFMVAFAFYVGLETGIGGWMPSHLESTGLQPLAAATLTSGFWLALAAGRLFVAALPARLPERAIVITGSAVAAVALLTALVPTAAPVAYIVAGLAIAPIFPTGSCGWPSSGRTTP